GGGTERRGASRPPIVTKRRTRCRRASSAMANQDLAPGGGYNHRQFAGLEKDPMSEVTRILSAIEQGDPNAAGELLPLVYDELRQLAAHRLAHQTPGQTLQPTALVHEAYLRLVGDPAGDDW